MVVKVTDKQLNIYTHLTVFKFEERLADMRELLRSNTPHEECLAVFSDPGGSWKSSLTPSISRLTGNLATKAKYGLHHNTSTNYSSHMPKNLIV